MKLEDLADGADAAAHGNRSPASEIDTESDAPPATWRDEPAWLEAQFNNRARVADHADILRRWADASALSRERSRVALDIPYGAGPRERLDVFRPTSASPGGAPVLVFIHGGWWRSLGKQDYSFVAPSFATAGAVVVLPGYDLCPAASIETIVLQMTQALAWTWRHIADHGGDPRRIVVAGHSAGGHLATMLLCCDWTRVAPDLPSDLVTQVCSVSGVYDLAPVARTPFLKADLRLAPADVERLSPAGFPAPRGRRLMAFVGALESDEFRRQNRLMQQRWGRDVVPVCEEVPDTHHFDVMHAFADPDAPLHAAVRGALGLGIGQR